MRNTWSREHLDILARDYANASTELLAIMFDKPYERIPSTDVHRTITDLTDAVSLDTWKKSVKPYYDGLIGKVEMEESWANAALNQVTR
ncbi:hypothetical protein AABB92_04635 [Pantoea brenneri]|uniref:Uncharacterized protein n=1 Tax=Pantoea brenneri TaxID=472694 RepID=A0ABU9MJN5_9GAMM|nr:hypothetical protein [Pantoea sp. 3.5.1]KKD33181.1 hypothetical protein EP46_04515 [Pantoea sp. 3.5.1]